MAKIEKQIVKLSAKELDVMVKRAISELERWEGKLFTYAALSNGAGLVVTISTMAEMIKTGQPLGLVKISLACFSFGLLLGGCVAIVMHKAEENLYGPASKWLDKILEGETKKDDEGRFDFPILKLAMFENYREVGRWCAWISVGLFCFGLSVGVGQLLTL